MKSDNEIHESISKKKRSRWPFRLRSFLLKSFALTVAALIWLPILHYFYIPKMQEGTSTNYIPMHVHADFVVNRFIGFEIRSVMTKFERMHSLNPEWDFMSRTYFVLSLTNMSLRDPNSQSEYLPKIDSIINHTLQDEREKGHQYFLLSYGQAKPWTLKPPRSLFVDGEIALMLAARRMVKENTTYKPLLQKRIKLIINRMQKSPDLCAESYPDECWLFCNTISLAAIRMSDYLDGTDHSDFLQHWIKTAKQNLIETKTGLLISTFTMDGKPISYGYGPEGSSIWMACHMLQIVDPDFAKEQYQKAKKELADSFLGFGYSMEWPRSVTGDADIDSGPILPVLGASPSASGLALIAAAAFEDRDYFERLMSSLNLVGFPVHAKGVFHYHAADIMGNAVVLYAMVQGPLWDKLNGKVIYE